MDAKEHFTKTEIAEQLNRILSVPTFHNSRVLSDFLRFIVDNTLAGKEQEIKEYTIGVRVLSRHVDFNPQLDAIVRTHAGRLRRALKEYYYELGKDDPIVIEIPKGSYIPLFQPVGSIEHTGKNVKKDLPSNNPTIAVLPFRNISKDSSRDFFADGVAEQLSSELTWFNELTVISFYSSRHAAGLTTDIRETGVLLGARYLLTGSIQNDDEHLRIQVQLIVGETSEQLWSISFERNNTSFGLYEIQNEIVKNILAAIGGYYGVISRHVLKAPYNMQTDDMQTYDATFLYYHYQKIYTKEIFQKTVKALEAAVKANPNFALGWAMLGELYMDDKAMEFKEINNPLEQALKCAQHAIALDPNCQHGYMSLSWVYLFHDNKEECINAVDQCIAINPNSAEKAGAVGFVLVCAGEFDRGFALSKASIMHNPFQPWWYFVGFVFYSIHKREYQQALHWAVKINRQDLFWDPMLKASILAHLNRMEEARKNLDLFVQLAPDTSNQVKDILEGFLLSQDLTNEILEGLRRAGLNSQHSESYNEPEKAIT